MQIGFRQDLEIAGSSRKVGDEQDGLGSGGSELEERLDGGLESGSRGLVADYGQDVI